MLVYSGTNMPNSSTNMPGRELDMVFWWGEFVDVGEFVDFLYKLGLIIFGIEIILINCERWILERKTYMKEIRNLNTSSVLESVPHENNKSVTQYLLLTRILSQFGGELEKK